VELLDFSVGKPYRRAFILGELFYLAWESEGDIFRFGVFHFDPKNETIIFKYGIKIGNSAEYVAVTRVTVTWKVALRTCSMGSVSQFIMVQYRIVLVNTGTCHVKLK